jgi:hypothetical protein
VNDVRFLGHSSADILLFLTVAAILLGLSALIAPVVIPSISARFGPPSHGGTLEETKAALEIQDLRFGWMRLLGTAVLTAAIAVGGWAFQEQASRDDRIQREQSAQRDTLAHFLGDLGDGNATKRIAAATYLASLLAFPASQAPEPTYHDAENNSREAVIISALTYRNAVETDSSVEDFVTQAIITAGKNQKIRKRIIEAVAHQNVALFNRMSLVKADVSDYLSEVAESASSRYARLPRSSDSSAWQNHIAQINDEVNGAFAGRSDLTMYGVLTTNGFAKDYTEPPLRFVDWKLVLQKQKQNIGLLRDFQTKILNTSRTIVAMLGTNGRDSGAPDDLGIDLSGVFLYSPDLSLWGVRLRGANLESAIVATNMHDTRIELSNLSYANLSHSVVFPDSTLRGDEVDSAVLPTLEWWTNGTINGTILRVLHMSPNIDPFHLPNALVGTDWPFAFRADAVHPDSGPGPEQHLFIQLRALREPLNISVPRQMAKQYFICARMDRGFPCPWKPDLDDILSYLKPLPSVSI